MTFSRYITLSDIDIFNDYQSVDLDKLLGHIPKEFLINFTSNLSYRMLYRTGSFDIDNDIFLKLFEFEGVYVKHLAKIFNKIQEEDGFKRIILFTPIANLKIQQFAILKGNENQRKTTPNDYINLFKAYLFLNEQYSFKSDKITEYTQNKDDNQILLTYYLTLFFYQLEFLNPAKDYFIQIFKAILFFKFAESSELEPFLKTFLEERGYDTWQSFIKNVASVFLRQFNMEDYVSYKDSKYIIQVDPKSTRELTLLNGLDIVKSKKSTFDVNDNDFKILRKYPLFKIKEDQFIFLNLKFFLDKLFNSLQFDFYDILKRKDKNLTLPLFRTNYYSQKFVEEYLLNYILFEAFKNKFKVFKSKNFKGFECSDFYLIHFNNLILIECKDIIISAEVKNSQDPKAIYEYIKSRLIEDAGVHQLIKTIIKIDEGKSKQDAIDDVQSKYEKIVVFPIIVYTDRTLDINGVNFYLNSIFEDELSKISLKKVEVKKLILININFLVEYIDVLKVKNFDFLMYLKEYDKYLNKISYETYDFNSFVSSKLIKKLKSQHSKATIIKEFWKNNDIKIDY